MLLLSWHLHFHLFSTVYLHTYNLYLLSGMHMIKLAITIVQTVIDEWPLGGTPCIGRACARITHNPSTHTKSLILEQVVTGATSMATPPAPKRSRLLVPAGGVITREGALLIAKKAADIPFPWEEAVPENVATWMEAFAKAHNTRPEFIYMGALTTTAAIMGPKSKMQVSSTYAEPTNLYAICISQPGAGKSQAFRLAIIDPVSSLSASSSMMVDDYTRQGLFKHLRESKGRAYVAQEEMTAFFDLVQRRQLEGAGERQLYCRLYDASGWIKTTGETP